MEREGESRGARHMMVSEDGSQFGRKEGVGVAGPAAARGVLALEGHPFWWRHPAAGTRRHFGPKPAGVPRRGAVPEGAQQWRAPLPSSCK